MSGRAPRGPVIAIDGPSGVGKTTISRMLAERLGLIYINTGSMYRALALAAFDAGVDLGDDEALERFCASVEMMYADAAITVNGIDYAAARLREQRTGELASVVSARKPVRELLVRLQRELGQRGGVVMEGRDIGTVVFPDADLKFFLDASHEVRARRRHDELAARDGAAGASDEVSREMLERDRRDSQRAQSPLKMAEDAVYVDTGAMSADEVALVLEKAARERL